MRTKSGRRKPEIVLRNGEPSAVILDIESYREMLELLEDKEDLAALRKLRMHKLAFRPLSAFLKKRAPHV